MIKRLSQPIVANDLNEVYIKARMELISMPMLMVRIIFYGKMIVRFRFKNWLIKSVMASKVGCTQQSEFSLSNPKR